MDDSKNISAPRRKMRASVAVVTTLLAGLGMVLWFAKSRSVSDDPLFRGKPEGEWIKDLKCDDEEEVKKWRAYGEKKVSRF